MTNCPSCGRDMETGFLGVPSGLAGGSPAEVKPPAWYRNKSGSGAGGDPLATSREADGMIYLSGRRCDRCRMLVLRY